MLELLQEMKEASEKKVWFRALELSKQDNIFVKSSEGSTRLFWVREPSKRGKFEVFLNPQEMDWGCTCSEPDSPCSHALAAAIAWKGEDEGRLLPRAEVNGWNIRYEIVQEKNKLVLKRNLARGQDLKEFEGKIGLLNNHSIENEKIEILYSSADLELDAFLTRSENYHGKIGASMLQFLRNLPVFFKDQKVIIGTDFRGYLLRIMKESGGIFLKIDEEEGQWFDDVFLTGNLNLFPAVKLPFSPLDADRLKKGRYLGWNETVDFYSRAYQKISSAMKVINDGYCVENMPLNVVVDGWEREHILCYRYQIAYGDPVVASLNPAGLKILSQGPQAAIPIRSVEAEEKLLYDFEKKTGLNLLTVYESSAPEAFEKARAILRSDMTSLGNSLERFANATQENPTLTVRQGRFFLLTSKGDVSLEELRMAQSTGGACRTSQGHWVEIPRGWFDGEGLPIMEILTLNGEAATAGSIISLQAVLENRQSLIEFKNLAHDWNQSFSLKQSPIKLRPYQVEGSLWLAKIQKLGLGGVLADDMGLGKTYQTLLSLETPALVIVPTSLLGNWQRELELARPDLKFSIYHGQKRILGEMRDVTITTYGVLRSDLEMFKHFTYETVVLDEAQQIKNPNSKTSMSVFQLKSRSRIALSGTPIENSLTDLWSVMHFCMPGLLGTLEKFRASFSRVEQFSTLKKLVSPFLLRRLKQEVAKELPDKIEQIIRCTMEVEQSDFYFSLLGKVQAEMRSQNSSLSVLTALLRLRQAACDPYLVDPSKDISSTKLDFLMEALGEVVSSGQSAIIFSQWTSLLDRVQIRIHKLGLTWTRLDGTTKSRDEVIDSFMLGHVPFMLISIKAGGTGLNLTRADHVFILDPWWNPAAEEQAIARAHRIGRQEKVIIHRLVTENTVEDKIMALKAEKMHMLEDLLSGRDAPGNLNWDDYQGLLS